MIAPSDFVRVLDQKGFRRFTGVPCSFFQSAINTVLADPTLRYTMAPNEGSALALASGAYLAGQPTAVMIQNSGFGNLINPLTSLNMIYHIPVLIFMSGRAYGVSDEPQHEIIGKTMNQVLDGLGVHHEDMPQEVDAFEKSLDKAVAFMEAKRQPLFFLVRKGSVGDRAPQKREASYPLSRLQAIGVISDLLRGDEFVVATTGMPSRELFHKTDRPRNFYMQGSMGHAASIGLGVALESAQKKVIVLDGDGALLMHMGILSSVGHYSPKNFYHVVLDNEAYETTGDQDTTSSTTDLELVAKASGYKRCRTVDNGQTLREAFVWMMAGEGPCFLRVKINRLGSEGIGRISAKHSAPQITDRFKKELGA